MKTIVYETYDKQSMNINLYYPEKDYTDKKIGVVVFFFGGGWFGGTVKQFEPQAKELARLGMVVALPEYRVLSRNHTPIETAVCDAIYSVSHLYEYAEEYGIDRDKIVLGGGSAGAHIALSAVLLDSFIPHTFQYRHRIRGLLLCNPVLDTVQFAYRAEAIKQSAYPPEALSPFHHMFQGMPDTIIFQGSMDSTVPVEIAREYTEKACILGNCCKLVEFTGKSHGFFNLRQGQIKEYYAVLGEMVQFLYEHDMFSIE